MCILSFELDKIHIEYYCMRMLADWSNMKRIAIFIAGWDSESHLYLINGLHERASQDNVDVYVYNCFGGWDDNSSFNQGEYNIYNLPDLSEFDGCIIAASLISSKLIRDKLCQKLIASKKPCISMEHDIPGMDYVGTDNYTGMYEMIEHLIKVHDCRNLCYVSGPDDNYESIQRYQSFIDLHKKYNLTYSEKDIYLGKFEFEDGINAVDFFMSNRDTLPDAFVCANDEMALGMIVELKKRGIQVPTDIRVVGFDNYLPGSQFSPRLSTVDRAKKKMGYDCCDHLIKMIQGKNIPSKVLLPTKLILSESCGCNGHVCHDNRAFRSNHLEVLEKNKNFHQLMRLMEEELISAKDTNQYSAALNRYLKQADRRDFYIMLNSRILDFTYETEQFSCIEGYDDHVVVAVAPENGLWKEGTVIKSNTSLPFKENSGRLIVYHPIHFQEKCLGYSISINDMFFLERDSQYTWLNIINNTLENCIRTMTLWQMNETLNKQYVTDPLTGLYNRFGYTKFAKKLYEKNKELGCITAVIFMDMNCLKKINDNFGHEQGDDAIKIMGICVGENCPKDAYAIRYGGDEFLIIATMKEKEEVESVISNIERSLIEKCRELLMPFDLTTSFGYVFTDSSKPEQLDDYVDIADGIMYYNKEKMKALKNPCCQIT